MDLVGVTRQVKVFLYFYLGLRMVLGLARGKLIALGIGNRWVQVLVASQCPPEFVLVFLLLCQAVPPQ